MVKAFEALDQGLLGDQVVAFRRVQSVQLQAIVRLNFRHWFWPGFQVLACLGVVTQTDQQIDQLQTQVIVIRVRRQQQLGVIGRHRVRLTSIGLEYFFTLEGRPQQTSHSNRHHRQCPGIEQAVTFSCRGADHYSPASLVI